MKPFEECTLDELSHDKQLVKQYYEYLESMKTTPFYKGIVESLEGKSILEIMYSIQEEEQAYMSEEFFPGDIVFMYPRIEERRAKKQITCDFSAGIIYPKSLYVNYRPMIYNVTRGETYVLKRTIKVETGYWQDLPTTIKELESLELKLQIDGYEDNSGIEYSHLSQRLGGTISLQKLKRRK